MRTTAGCLTAILLLFSICSANAEGVSLIPETEWVCLGTSFSVVVRLTMESGWHTYWINPGDSGMAPDLHWTLSPEVRLRGVYYPCPDRIEDEGLVTFGYEDAVSLLAEFDVSGSSTGTEFQIALDARWLVCKDVCEPRHGEARLQLAIDAEEAPLRVEHARMFADVRGSIPMRDPLWVFGARDEEGTLRLFATPPSEATDVDWETAEFFSAKPGAADLTAMDWTPSNGGAVLRIHPGPEPWSRGEILAGVLRVTKRKPLWVEIPIESGEGETR